VLEPRRASACVPELISGVVSDLTPALRGHQVRLEVADDLPAADVDWTLISRVLANLLENAARYAPKGTPITIGAEPRPPGAVLVFVVDHGPGVSPERRDEIFGLLARRESDAGAGIGLSIASSFIEAHGQRIWVEEAPGGGAKFCFTLPVAAEESKESTLAAGTHH